MPRERPKPFCALPTKARASPPSPRSSGRPATAKAFRTQTPRPNPQSQSFSRSYGSILPTSLTYIILSTRGCAPWRPDAVISTPGGASRTRGGIFKDPPQGTGRASGSRALPAVTPSLRVKRFQGHGPLTSTDNAGRTCVGRLPLTAPRCRSTHAAGPGILTWFPFDRRGSLHCATSERSCPIS